VLGSSPRAALPGSRSSERPQPLAEDDIAPLRAVGMSNEEVLDLLNAVAIFGWANRLMLNLGESIEAG